MSLTQSGMCICMCAVVLICWRQPTGWNQSYTINIHHKCWKQRTGIACISCLRTACFSERLRVCWCQSHDFFFCKALFKTLAKHPSSFPHATLSVLVNKYGAMPFDRDRHGDSHQHSGRHGQIQLTDSRSASNPNLQIEGTGREPEIKIGLTLGQIAPRGKALFSFRNVSSMHFGVLWGTFGMW